MIKRILGYLLAAAIVALLVLVCLNHGNYRTMIPTTPNTTKLTAPASAPATPVEAASSDTTLEHSVTSETAATPDTADDATTAEDSATE